MNAFAGEAFPWCWQVDSGLCTVHHSEESQILQPASESVFWHLDMNEWLPAGRRGRLASQVGADKILRAGNGRKGALMSGAFYPIQTIKPPRLSLTNNDR